MKLFCIDVGYIETKFCLYEDDIRQFPSFVKQITGEGHNRVLEVDGSQYVFGEVARQSKHSTFSLKPRATDLNTYLLIQAAMGQVLSPNDEVFLVTGLPDKEHPIYKEEFLKRLQKTGTFIFNGVEYNIKIRGVKVHKQSKGMFFSQLFKADGSKNETLEDLKIGIAEMGWRTMHLAQIVELEYMDDFSETFDLGVYNICKELSQLIYQDFKVTYHPEQLEKTLYTHSITLYGNPSSIQSQIELCYQNHVDRILRVMENQWPNLSSLDVVFFGSGGFQPLYERFFLPLPQFSNNSTLLDRYDVLKGYRRAGLFELGGDIENAKQRGDVLQIFERGRENKEMVV